MNQFIINNRYLFNLLYLYILSYQACTEMVMPFCFKGENGKGSKDMFEPKEWNKTAVAEECKKKWKVTPRFRMADIMYGSKKLEAASNIVFR